MKTTLALATLLTLAMPGCGKKQQAAPPAPAAPAPAAAVLQIQAESTSPPAAEQPAQPDPQLAVNEPMPPFDEGESAPPEIAGHGQLTALKPEKRIAGEITLYQFGDGSRMLRVENLHTPPELQLDLVLTQAPAPKTADDLQGMLRVGVLKGPSGNMNYLIDKSTDLSGQRSVALVVHGQTAVVAHAVLTRP